MNKVTESLISAFVVLILIAFLIHEPLLMPMGVQMLMIVAASILFLALVAFLFKEEARDEREKLHKLAAGRFSFIVGSSFLLFGIGLGVLKHDIDPFLPITLVAMIISKVIYRRYSERNK